MLRKDLTKLVKRDDITPDSFEILGISLSGYTAGEAAVNARVSPLGQCLLRDVPVKSERSKTNDDLHTQHQRAASLTRPSRRSPQNLEDRSSRRSSLGRCLRPLCPRRCSSTWYRERIRVIFYHRAVAARVVCVWKTESGKSSSMG